jgi:putative membrane protein
MLKSAQMLADFDGHMDWDGGWGIVMLIGMVLFWAVVIAAAVWLLRELGLSRRGAGSPDDPLRILDRRLADGSISIEEYQQRRAVLLDSARER